MLCCIDSIFKVLIEYMGKIQQWNEEHPFPGNIQPIHIPTDEYYAVRITTYNSVSYNIGAPVCGSIIDHPGNVRAWLPIMSVVTCSVTCIGIWWDISMKWHHQSQL